MDPYNHNTSFLNLLTSQQPNQYELGSEEVLVFSTQGSDADQVSDDDDQPTENHKGRRSWSPSEDVVLISAWLNTSKDPVIGNEQKTGAFWKRITAYYNASLNLVGPQRRELDHCKQRWKRINASVCKYVGSYESATKQKSSGQNEDDVMKLAYQIFQNDYNIRFTLEHAWRELRNEQKWCMSIKDNGNSKRRKFNGQSSSGVPASHGEEDDGEARPQGVKTAKKKGKQPTSKLQTVEEGMSLSDFQSLWEIRQKAFELKQKEIHMNEKQSKHKYLESLLAKTELTEAEIALKDKLITNMLSNA